jgi:hypothetical protein
MIMTMKMGRSTQSRRAGSRNNDCVEVAMVNEDEDDQQMIFTY